MGMCQPSGGKYDQTGHIGSLKSTGEPNTRIDLKNEKNELIQQRWYGPDGRAIMNRDWKHPNKGGEHKFPHDHPWDWTKKKPRLDYDENREQDNNFC